MEQIISFFKNVASREPQDVDLWAVYEGIRTGRWQRPVERVRRAVAQGDKKEADRAKRSLPYMEFTGRFVGGHRAAQLVDYRPCCVLDYDNLPPETLAELRQRALLLPFVEAVFISASGRGLKVVVVTDAVREQHTEAYEQATAFVDPWLGIESDPKCKDISHGHYISSDPEMVYRQVTEPFRVQTETIFTDATENATENAPENATATPEAVAPEAVAAFVRSYLTLYPAPEGNRNQRLFSLACTACKRGLAEAVLVRAVIDEMAASDFDTIEIERTVKSAYHRASDSDGDNSPRKRTDSALSAYTVSESDINDQDEDEILDGEYLRAHTPTFPAMVYDTIPSYLGEVVKHVDGERERDMLLLATITTLSAMFYNANGYYDKKLHWPCLYAYVVAPAASSKGIMEIALRLCKYYLQSVAEQNEKLEKKYKEELEAYEDTLRRKKNEKRPPKPEPPVCRYPHIPANTSKARFIEHLRENGAWAGLVFTLESDTLFSALKQDYGDFWYIFRNAFHHEEVSASHKVDGKPKYVHCPKVALVMAGTPGQFFRMLPTAGDGTPSRFLLYTHRQPPRWRDVSPGDDEEALERHLDQLAMSLHQKILFLQSSHTRIRLSVSQWRKLNETFAALLNESVFHDHEDYQSCVKRHGLMTFRICMIFALLDKAAMRMDVPALECSDAYFEAALSIVVTCLEHGRLLLTGVWKSEKEIPELENPDKVHLILKRLPVEFSAAQFAEQAAAFDMKKRSMQKLLKKCIDVYISKIARGMYKKKL